MKNTKLLVNGDALLDYYYVLCKESKSKEPSQKINFLPFYGCFPSCIVFFGTPCNSRFGVNFQLGPPNFDAMCIFSPSEAL